jgi:hypothetical protein
LEIPPCDPCCAKEDRAVPLNPVPQVLYLGGDVVEPALPSCPLSVQPEGLPASTAALVSLADKTNHCLKCNEQTPGAYYRFWVARKQRRGQNILHEEKAFLCDRCAEARVRFAPQVVLFLWAPLLALVALIVCRTVVRDLLLLSTLGSWSKGSWVELTFRVALFGALVMLLVGLVRLAWRQLHAARWRLFHHLPYSGSIAQLAIQLRKKVLLRSLRLSESSALFLTEEDRQGGAQSDGGASTGETRTAWQGGRGW